MDNTILDRIRIAIANEVLDGDPDQLSGNTSFRDLGMSSIDVMQCVFAIETEFKSSVRDGDIYDKMKDVNLDTTINQVAELVQEVLWPAA